MIALILVAVWVSVIVLVALLLTDESTNNERQDHEQQRIDQAKQHALSDIRRRRERAEDQLRRLSRWQR